MKLKVAAAVYDQSDYSAITGFDSLFFSIEKRLCSCMDEEVKIIVFSALLGCLFGNAEEYLERIKSLSVKFPLLYICPGTFWQKERENTYHSSCVVNNGEIVLWQQQIYLAKWEREKGLSRGDKLNTVKINGVNTAILVSTDVFYPQVSRVLGLQGAELVLAPVAIKNEKNMALQASGLWREVQQNLFFGVECGFKGTFENREFYSSSVIHAPLEMTEREDGILKIESKEKQTDIIIAELNNKKRKECLKKFNVYGHFNPELYKKHLP